MSVNDQLSYVLNELAKVDRFSKKGMPYDLILTIKGHIMLEFLEWIKRRMERIDYDLIWSDYPNQRDRMTLEIQFLDRLSDTLMSLTDWHGSRLVEVGVFEKHVITGVIDWLFVREFDVEADPEFIWDY